MRPSIDGAGGARVSVGALWQGRDPCLRLARERPSGGGGNPGPLRTWPRGPVPECQLHRPAGRRNFSKAMTSSPRTNDRHGETPQEVPGCAGDRDGNRTENETGRPVRIFPGRRLPRRFPGVGQVSGLVHQATDIFLVSTRRASARAARNPDDMPRQRCRGAARRPGIAARHDTGVTLLTGALAQLTPCDDSSTARPSHQTER